MCSSVSLFLKSLKDYRTIAGKEENETIRLLADSIRSVWILHLNADLLHEEFDIVIIHDLRSLAIHSANHVPDRSSPERWAGCCCLDIAAARWEVWPSLLPHVEVHDAATVTIPEYVKNDLHVQHIEFVPPAVDPLGRTLFPFRKGRAE